MLIWRKEREKEKKQNRERADEYNFNFRLFKKGPNLRNYWITFCDMARPYLIRQMDGVRPDLD